MLVQSDASEALDARWDDGTFVVDPEETVRSAGHRDGDRVRRVRRDVKVGFDMTSLATPDQTSTFDEWADANGYDPVTRTYA